jgi:hypothetical protein
MNEQHVMIDVETWDNTETSVVRAAALVHFNPHSGKIYSMAVIDARASLDDQLEAGRTVGSSTVAWWAKKDVSLSAALEENFWQNVVHHRVGTLSDLAALLLALLEDVKQDGPLNVWTRGNFDVAIVGGILDHSSLVRPWHFGAVRDCRSFDPFIPKPKAALEHHPLSDCLAQIQQVKSAASLLAAERVNEAELKALCGLIMCADPTPLSEADDESVKRLADSLAMKAGFSNWIEAYHKLPGAPEA